MSAERKEALRVHLAAQQAAANALAAQQLADASFAQTFNSALACASLPAGALSTITYPRNLSFELRNKFWGRGDATITGPGGHGWFRMARSNPSVFGEMFRNAHFAITTLSGQPLLVLQENFRWMNYE